MRINHPQIPTLYYDVKPSAFSRLDFILHTCLDIAQVSLFALKGSTEEKLSIKHKITLISYIAASYVVGAATTALLTAVIPLTITIDLVVGLAECILCKRRGYSNSDILKIAHSKFIVSPLHQIAVFSVLTAVDKVACLILLKGCFFWIATRPIVELLLVKAPSVLKSANFSIFSKSGLLYTSYKTEIWKKLIEKESLQMTASEKPSDYQRFKRDCLAHSDPQTILEPNYKKLSLALHPDRNLDNTEESKVLFEILVLAKDALPPETFFGRLKNPNWSSGILTQVVKADINSVSEDKGKS